MPGNMNPAEYGGPGPSRGGRRREERKKHKSHIRMERHIEAVRDFNFLLLNEIRTSRYPDCDVTEEDARQNTTSFQIREAYHGMRTYVTAALLARWDAAYAKDLMLVALSATGQDLELVIKDGSTSFSTFTLEERPSGVTTATCYAVHKYERRSSLFYLGLHPEVHDLTNQTRWELAKSFWSSLAKTQGLVLESEGRVIVSDSNDHPRQNLKLQRRRHSRLCELANAVDKGTLVLELIMERDEEIAAQVRVLANLQVCNCLAVFRTEPPKVRVEVPITLRLGASEEQMWSYRPWLEQYLLTETQNRPVSWWLRLFAYFTMLTTCSTWDHDPCRFKVTIGIPRFVDLV